MSKDEERRCKAGGREAGMPDRTHTLHQRKTRYENPTGICQRGNGVLWAFPLLLPNVRVFFVR